MLKFFRKKKIVKIIFGGLLVLILPAFVLLGVGSLSSLKRQKGSRFAGQINRKRISFDELFESVAAMRTLIMLNYFNQPKLLDAFLRNKPLLVKLAWDRLVMLKEAGQHKIKVSDKEVIDYIRSHPLFSRNGKFDDKLYGHILRYNTGLAPRSFEEMIRGNLEVQKLNAILTKDITISDDEILNEYRRENERFKISYLLIETKDFLDKVKVDEAKVKDYYEKHKTEFILPAKEGEEDRPEVRIANFEDVKAGIHSHLAEKEAAALSFNYAQELHGEIKELMEKEGGSFEGAVTKSGLKAKDSPFFSSHDYLEGIGEASTLAQGAVNLKPDEISSPIGVRKGVIIFKILDFKGIDGEKFKKDKEEFAKEALEKKKTKWIDGWFSKSYLRNRLNIDLETIDKYYR